MALAVGLAAAAETVVTVIVVVIVGMIIIAAAVVTMAVVVSFYCNNIPLTLPAHCFFIFTLPLTLLYPLHIIGISLRFQVL